MKKIIMRLKKFIAGLIVLVALFSLPQSVLAEETCTTVYGQGVVCGAKTPEEFVHEPVKAGFETNIRVLGFGLIAASGAAYFFSKKTRPSASLYIDL